jgi:hypothetical protein
VEENRQGEPSGGIERLPRLGDTSLDENLSTARPVIVDSAMRAPI